MAAAHPGGAGAKSKARYAGGMFRIAGWLLLLAAGAAGETHRVVAATYHHTFSRAHPVLLRVRPGDRVITKTVDSAGFDFQGVRRTKTHGNPLTGPFFIEGAEPGDALLVRIERIRLNRASGYSGYQVSAGALPPELAADKPRPDAVYAGYDYLRPWEIDLARQTVRLREPRSGRLALEFPAAPMLGCIGVAPEGDYAPRSGPAGYWGGNLDYRQIREGATVWLPVFHPGGLLFLGDGHALQGDGEAVGSGVETSLDVEFSVELKKGYRLITPRVETAEWIVSVGAQEKGEFRETLELATRDLLRWLVADYRIEPWAAHVLLGMQARYEVASLAGVTAAGLAKRLLPAR
jgi:amidase